MTLLPRTLRRPAFSRARARDYICVGGVWALLVLAPPALAAPPAGSAIDNQAQANAALAAGPLSAASNLVRAIVQSLDAWTLARDRSDTLAAGGTATFPHRLTNGGNGPADARLDLVNLAGDDFDLAPLALIHDLDGDGAVDAGEPALAPGGTLTLPAGGVADLLALATLPGGVPAAARAWLRLSATGVASGTVAANTDTLVVEGTAAVGAALFVEKTAARGVVEVGDDLDYTVRVANRSDTSFAAVTVSDRLPLGFAYVPATARRDGVAIADPSGGQGPALAFALGALDPGGTATLRYRVRVSPGARDGDGVNRVWAAAGTVVSNGASARVAVSGGVFADEGTVVGTVFVDRDGDRRRGAAEPGLAGVRLYLDDGTFAVTDTDGRYSFYGLPPRTHALKADATTLPVHGRMVSVDHRQGEGSGVRFVDLQAGDLQRADFAFAPDPRTPSPTPRDSAVADSALIAETRARAGRLRAAPDELTRGLGRELPAATRPAEGDLRGRPAAGLVDDVAAGPLLAAAGPAEDAAGGAADEGPGPRPGAPWPGRAAGDSAAAPRVESPAPGAEVAVPLEDLLPALDATPGFVGVADGDTARARRIAVAVKGPRGYRLELRVNGTPLGPDRVGRRVTVADRGLEVWEYVGVALSAGENQLELAQREAGGRVLAGARIAIIAPGSLARLALVAPGAAPADRESRTAVRVRALDERGVPVPERTFVTLETSLGRWLASDLDPARPGLQTVLEGGEAVVALAPPDAPGSARLSVVAVDAPAGGALRAERSIAFVPGLRPLLVVGSAEGAIALRDLLRGRGAIERRPAGFETPMTGFASRLDAGRIEAGARGALFARGRLVEAVQLTVGFDSERAPGTRRFRDIQPDAYYPIYGDASARGYEAQSTGRLYARVDRHGASLLYGDFVTQGLGGARSLSAYSRTLTGVQQRYETGRVRLESFGSRERGRHQVDELPGRGISGPYTIGTLPIVENSERVEILVRDRAQPAVVLAVEPRTRFVDYTLETATGRLLFTAPVPSVDAALNPVSIRVSYEVPGGGAAFWVAGGEGRVRVGPRLELGGSWVDDHDPSSPFGLRSAFAGAKLGEATTLEGEVATSARGPAGDGQAARVELRHEGTRAAGRLFGAVTDSGFVNPGGGFGAGRSEAGGRFSLRVAGRSRLLAEGLYTADAAAGDRRGGALVALDQGLTATTRGEFGVRVAGGRRTGGIAEPTGVALRGKLLAQLPRRPELSGYAELEQDVRSSRRMAAVGGEYRYSSRGRLYARHELSSSLTSVYALRAGERRLATVFGVDTDVAPDAHVFSEYRLADAIAGREAEAAIGLRNAWRVDGWRVSTTFERVNPLGASAADAGPVTALTGALETATEDDTRASARMEYRTGRANDALLSTIGLASRLDPSLTLLGRSIASISDERSRGVAVRMRLQLGLAYRRPDGEHWDVLSRYELHVDRESNRPLTRRARSANVISVHGTGRSFDLVTATLSWAGKRVREESDGILSHSGAHRLHARIARDFARHWDFGVHGSGFWGTGSDSRRHGLGVELGRKLQRDVWLSAGWNHFGYRDPDLPEEEWTEAGLYLRMRAKFDETLLRGLGMAR
jgi:uncharacterized repeat protein (TIGR01451 family)